MTLEERFDEKIKEARFNPLELTGFQQKPLLAVKAGVAIGYQMAIDDILKARE